MAAFNFGSGGSNTPNKPLFGANNTSGGSTPSLFGTSNTPVSSTPSLFGNINNNANTGSGTPGTKSVFGGASTGGAGLFGGGASTTPAATKSNPFGGNQPSAGSTGQTGSTPPFSFGKPAGSGPAGGDSGNAPKPSLFGAVPTGATPSSGQSFSFGQPTGAQPASSQPPASTPAASKTFTLNSTTPAGPPPGTSLFGGQNKQPGAGSQQSSSSLFAPKPAATSTSPAPNLFSPTATGSAPAKPLGNTPGGGFGGFSLGNKDASADANKGTPAQQPTATSGSNVFGGGAASGTSGTQATPKQSLFNIGSTTPASTPASKPPPFSLGAPTPASTQPSLSQPPAVSTTTPGNPLSLGGTQSTPASTAPPTNSLFNLGPGGGAGAGGTSTSGFSFGKPPASAPTSTTATSGAPTSAVGASSGAAAPSLFSGLGGSNTPASSGPTATSAPAPSLFNLGSKPATASTQPSTSTTASAPANPTSSASTMNPLGATSGAMGGDSAKGGLATSTAGPAPSTQSRLKNKSMDEIITRWAADLSKYQKEFQSQAEQIAEWDRALVDNTEKVKQLYSKTFQAERDAAEVERQLRNVEENQQELDVYLDRYEKEVETLMKNRGVDGQGRSDGLRGPDQDRERTYKLAEKLQDRLNELNKDLTEMIEEINNTSQTLSKTGKPDDPLTKVVRVLNSQLSQLQLIDSGASQLQEKINKAQKESQRMGANGWNGLGTDPADDFLRSYRGGRTDRFGGVS